MTTPRGHKYILPDAATPNSPCNVPTCGLYELPSSKHIDDKTDNDAFFVQTCVEEVENAHYAMPQKPLFSMRGEEPPD